MASSFAQPVHTTPDQYRTALSDSGALPVDVNASAPVIGNVKTVPVSVERSYVSSEGSSVPVVVNDGGDNREFEHLIPKNNTSEHEPGFGRENLPQNTGKVLPPVKPTEEEVENTQDTEEQDEEDDTDDEQ